MVANNLDFLHRPKRFVGSLQKCETVKIDVFYDVDQFAYIASSQGCLSPVRTLTQFLLIGQGLGPSGV